MKSGDLVQVFVSEDEWSPLPGLAVFLRRVLPSRDLARDHEFWKNGVHESDQLANCWHNEILYDGSVRCVMEKQFLLLPVATAGKPAS